MQNFSKTILITLVSLFICDRTFAQWEISLGAGTAIPITGYGEVFKPGWLINVEGKHRFHDEKFAVGMNVHFARLQHDKNPEDMFQNARLTVAPVIFFAEYEFALGKIRPYVAAGIGLSMFNVTYDTTATSGYADFNLSFSMSPRAGLRYSVNERIYPYIEASLIVIADGPPIYFPHSEKLTGYGAITAGVCYRFSNK
jgi:hypothetical protein